MKHFTCRKAAVFSDIHSNYYALKACYEDAVGKGAEMFIFLGDYISDLADPQKTLDLVYEIRKSYPTACLRGNRERYMLDCKKGNITFSKGSKTGSLLYTYNQLRPQDFAFLESLPMYDELQINGVCLEIAHGSADDDRFYFEGTEYNADVLLQQMKYRYFFGGHCHRQYVYRRGDKTVCNPGSIGVPRDHACATQYAMLEVDEDVQITSYTITYDIPAMIHRQFESSLIEVAPYWAISILYDTITGDKYAMELLESLDEREVLDEQCWRRNAKAMGIGFTEQEILQLFEQLQRR